MPDGFALRRRSRAVVQSIARRRSNRAVALGATVAQTFLDAFQAPQAADHDIERNGEVALLRALSGSLGTVFDVGANVGDWTAAALRHGAGTVHAFEIAPPTSESLLRRFGTDDRVVVNAIGLADHDGTVAVRHFPERPALTTTSAYPHAATSVELSVPVTTGDRYVEQHGIDTIDLLKIDVEGAEESVLGGFASTLARGAVGVVQFEYGRVAILTKFLLHDAYALLGAAGFEIGRLTPTGVAFRPYSFDMEDFRDGNFVAVHRSRPDLEAAISRWDGS